LKYLIGSILAIMFATTINSIFTEKISLMEGEIAPSFELFDQDEKLLLSKNFLGKKFVVYFFPYADTPG
jgi:peroxiredoxin